jgi:aminoglycoside phosphotransferase (APT) family kinase protein
VAAEIVDTPEEAAGAALAPLLVRRPLERFLDGLGLGSGPLEARSLGDGHSNVTFLVERGGWRGVLRRPPRPPLPPSAHDMAREARVQRALEAAGARVPHVVALCEDESILGVPFYVMDYAEGDVITGRVPPALDSLEGRRRVAEELVDALVEIHAVDWRAAGLEGFGKPEGYNERQVRRFAGLWDVNKTRELPRVQEVGAWLAAHVPEQRDATVVHGDFRLGNVMYAREAPARVLAVMDWELSTIGDPLADLGYFLATYSEPGAEPNVLHLTTVTQGDGFPSRAELAARYGERSGRSVSSLAWYEALALWKSAVFCEAIYGRHLRGERGEDDPFGRLLEVGVPQLADAAAEAAAAAHA